MQATTDYALRVVLEFYATAPAIGIYPLRVGIREDDVLDRIRCGGYFTIKAAAYEDTFDNLRGLVEDNTVFVSTAERLVGILRYRQHENVGPSIKIESNREKEFAGLIEDLIEYS